MIFKLTIPLPKRYWIAVSGGIDSMAVLNFLNKPSRKDSLLGILHVNHNTGEYADKATEFVKSYSEHIEAECKVRQLKESPPPGESKEAWWRDRRYEFFHSFSEPIILGHNFDDCLESYIMNTMVRGYQSAIPLSNKNCIRPFMLWKRKDIKTYMEYNNYSWIEDPSNTNLAFKRNYVRHEIAPNILTLNPGVYNIVERLIVSQDD